LNHTAGTGFIILPPQCMGIPEPVRACPDENQGTGFKSLFTL